MERFRGQALPPRPRVAIFVSDKVGNFVVATTLMRGLRERLGRCTVDYFVDGERSREFVDASSLVDSRFRIEEANATLGAYDLGVSSDMDPVFVEAMARLAPTYVAGPCAGLPELPDRIGELWAEPDWNRSDLLDDFGDLLASQYIGEIWCRLASVETDYVRAEVPLAEPRGGVPDVLLASGGTRKTKLWPATNWSELARLLRRDGLSVGLIGIGRELQARYYGAAVEDDDRLVRDEGVVDLRGRWTLPEVAGACRAAAAVITIDSAIGHIAAAVGANTAIVWGGSPSRLWAPRRQNVLNLLPDQPGRGPDGVTPTRVYDEVRGRLAGAIA